MKTIKVIPVFILLLFINTGNSQWYANYTSRGYDCSFINENTGWTGGNHLQVFKTTNCGENWSLIYSPVSDNIIYSIFFTDSIHGWAGTYTGEILRTTNGGYDWVYKLVAYNRKIYSLYFINNNTGWFTGENGAYGKTTNGGVTWISPGALFGTDDGYCIYFRDSLNGYACGYGKLGKTTNGGSIWEITNYNNVRLSAISFLNAQTGFALGSLQNNTIVAASLYVIKTTNNGLNWLNVYTEPYTAQNVLMVNESHFHNENEGLYSGTMIYPGPVYSFTGVLGKTTNGGLNWSYIYYYFSSTLESIEFVNSLTGFATNGTAVYKTTNGGIMYINKISTELPEEFELEQNYPNPFNSSTNIKFSVQNVGQSSVGHPDLSGQTVTIKIFDISGKEVASLVNEKLQAGVYSVRFDAGNLPSGIYFYRLQTENFSATKKLILLK